MKVWGNWLLTGWIRKLLPVFSGMLGKTATATKADMSDLAKMTYAFSDALKISDPKELEEAFAIAATGAKLGSL